MKMKKGTKIGLGVMLTFMLICVVLPTNVTTGEEVDEQKESLQKW